MTTQVQTKIADVLHPSDRFFRSALLERDFHDPTVFSGYVVTDFALSCLNRLQEGLQPTSGKRAWRITGDFGSGKSSFALLLAHWFAGHDKQLPRAIKQVRSERPFRRYVPALVTCNKQPLTIAILKALHSAVAFEEKFAAKRKLTRDLETLLALPNKITDDQVLDLLLDVNTALYNSKQNGLLLVIDELGKFLEFAAINSETQDVFLLQRIAELASRSGKQPLFVVCLLHQGFGEYAASLSQVAQHEWEKVAGRFEQVLFDQPLDQIAQLISCALDVQSDLIPKTKRASIQRAMRYAVELRWFGTANAQAMVNLATELYPLNPILLPVLIRIFRRFGQNERSLFSFLFSNEPFGLRSFCENSLAGSQLYSLHNFYDYVRTNFGHRLTTHSFRSHWNLIESVIDSFAAEDELQLKILKTVGILNLVNDNDLLASEEAILCSTAEQAIQSSLKNTLERLHHKRALYYRGHAGGFCLWPHTSVDLEKAYDEARRALRITTHVMDAIDKYLEKRPIVARRHYIKTGNLRHYAIHYYSVADLESVLADSVGNSADGQIVILLCETSVEQNRALAFAKSSSIKDRQGSLVAVSQPLSTIANLLQEVQRWEWIGENTKELNGDRYAREEVARQRQISRSHLERRLQSLVGIKHFSGQTSLQWFHEGQRLKIRNSRELLVRLSEIMDQSYPAAPQIQNELVNRSDLSSAAAAARIRLIERMFENPSAAFLGMNPDHAPPEMSMYLSILRHSGVHREKNETWSIIEPHYKSDRCNLLPTFRRIRQLLEQEPHTRINVAQLFDELRKPPYGVRNGLIPLLLTIFALAHEGDVAFYKDGVFLREMNGESMLVLTKAPSRFEIQSYKTRTVQRVLYERLASVLELQQAIDGKLELLDIVTPLCVFVSKLPNCVLKTRRLSVRARDVRNAILDARDPAKLLFQDLPTACGFEHFSTNDGLIRPFVRELKVSLDELRSSYPELIDRLQREIRNQFEIEGSFEEFRNILALRAEQMLIAVTDPKLRAFCLRLMDASLGEVAWTESLGSYLALRPPGRWQDGDEESFMAELAEASSRFRHVESINFDGAAIKDTLGIRVGITQSNGLEESQVIYYSQTEELQVTQLQKRIEKVLLNNRRLGVAAASRAIWQALQSENGTATYD